jgi:membrane protein DedA with SNARE-associated domain
MGFGFALVTLITAGIAKVPFKKYMILNVSGQLIWTAILLGIGYLFGNIYTTIDASFRNIALVGLIIIAILLVYGFGRYVSKRLGERL